MDATTLTAKKSRIVPDDLTATNVTSPPSINSLLLNFSTIVLTVTTALTVTALTATDRQYLTVNIRHHLTSVITNLKTVTNLPTAPTKSETVSDYPIITFATTTNRITNTDHTTDITKTDTMTDRLHFAAVDLYLFLIP
ncbi:hypothetical protein OG21DRAFT_1489776 [Imleria badia]|nr:hypothetical protein OG21DRAFT_1489776 [Imleria badia]